MTCNREVQLFADDSVKSPKLFSLKLTPVQNINKSLSSLRPISRNDDEIGGTHESIFHIQPPTYQQFGKLDSNSSVPFWVSRFHERTFCGLTNILRPKQFYLKAKMNIVCSLAIQLSVNVASHLNQIVNEIHRKSVGQFECTLESHT